MHHSMNYRCVMVFGKPQEIESETDKRAALERLVSRAGRSVERDAPSERLELRATRVFALELREVSVKCRRGGPLDDAEDLALPYWRG